MNRVFKMLVCTCWSSFHLRTAYATRLKYLCNSVLIYSWSIKPNKYRIFYAIGSLFVILYSYLPPVFLIPYLKLKLRHILLTMILENAPQMNETNFTLCYEGQILILKFICSLPRYFLLLPIWIFPCAA
jgi:hypothetical protein